MTDIIDVHGVPGPGAYRPEASPLLKKGVQFSMRGRTKTTGKVADIPSPAHYKVSDKLTRPGVPELTTGFHKDTGKPRKAPKTDVPPPNQYKPQYPENVQLQFSFRGRPKIPAAKPGTDQLGPGSYNSEKVKTGPQMPQLSIGKRFTSPNHKQNPAPNAYSPQVKKGSPMLSFRGRTHGQIPKDSPGPGQYTIIDPPKGVQQSFGKGRYKRRVHQLFE